VLSEALADVIEDTKVGIEDILNEIDKL